MRSSAWAASRMSKFFCPARTAGLGQMPVKQGMAQAIHFRVRLQNALRVRHVTLEEALMNLLQHFAEQRSHLHQLAGIRRRQFFTARLQVA
jgi:hypothetical protein